MEELYISTQKAIYTARIYKINSSVLLKDNDWACDRKFSYKNETAVKFFVSKSFLYHRKKKLCFYLNWASVVSLVLINKKLHETYYMQLFSTVYKTRRKNRTRNWKIRVWKIQFPCLPGSLAGWLADYLMSHKVCTVLFMLKEQYTEDEMRDTWSTCWETRNAYNTLSWDYKEKKLLESRTGRLKDNIKKRKKRNKAVKT